MNKTNKSTELAAQRLNFHMLKSKAFSRGQIAQIQQKHNDLDLQAIKA